MFPRRSLPRSPGRGSRLSASSDRRAGGSASREEMRAEKGLGSMPRPFSSPRNPSTRSKRLILCRPRLSGRPFLQAHAFFAGVQAAAMSRCDPYTPLACPREAREALADCRFQSFRDVPEDASSSRISRGIGMPDDSSARQERLGGSFHPSRVSLRLRLQLGSLFGAPFRVGLKIGNFRRDLLLKFDKSIG